MPFSISGLLSSRETDIDQRALSRGMITVLLWKKACINLFITYFNIELKRTKLTFLCLDFSYFLQKSPFLLPKPQQIFSRWTPTFSKRQLTGGRKWRHGAHERLHIMLSEFCPDICPWPDIAVALPVFTYGQNWRYYL